MHVAQRTRTRLIATLAVVIVALLTLAALHRYNDHAGVRARALRGLQDAANAAAQTTSSGGGGAPAAAAPAAGAGAGDGVSLPIGQVDTTPPSITGPTDTTTVPPSTPTAPATAAPTRKPGTGSGGGGSGDDGAPPSDAPTPKKVSIAVITPLLSTFQFGSTTGFLLACNTAAGSVSAAAAQVPGLSQALTPVLSEISPSCGKLSAAAVTGLQTMNDDLAVLAPLTPGTAPYFAALNQVFADANAVAPSLQPFSGTITSLGPLVDFFSGAPPSSQP